MSKKCLWILQAFMMVAILSVSFTACKEDNVIVDPAQDNPYEPLPEDEKKIVGAWCADENSNYYYEIWFFLADHTCEKYEMEKDNYEYFSDNYYDYYRNTGKKTGTWEYNSLTKQLTTTINGTYWLISLMTNEAWTGTSGNYGAVTYKRNYTEFAKYYLRKFGLISSYYEFEFNLKDDVLKAEEDAAPSLTKDKVFQSGDYHDLSYYTYQYAYYDGAYYTFPSGSDSYFIDYGFNVTNITSTEIQCKIRLGKFYKHLTSLYERTGYGHYEDGNGNYVEWNDPNATTYVYEFEATYDSPYIGSRYVDYFEGTLTLTDYYKASPKLVLDGKTMQTKKTYKKEFSLSEAK